MIGQANGIVLRSVKYGETSLVVTIFTDRYGVHAFLVQGVRSSSSGRNKAAYFQPGTLLDMVIYLQPQKNLHRIREYKTAYIYANIQESIIRNSVLLFSAEMLLRLLPAEAPFPELFSFAYSYLVALDRSDNRIVSNMPLYFLVKCSALLGYELSGQYTADTPYLNISEGGFSASAPVFGTTVTNLDSSILSRFVAADSLEELTDINMNSESRFRLIDWYLEFLQQHTQHLSNVRSLQVLRTILH